MWVAEDVGALKLASSETPPVPAIQTHMRTGHPASFATPPVPAMKPQARMGHPDVFKGSSDPREAADLTVSMFSMATVHEVMLNGRNASMRFCARCAAQPLTAPVKVSGGDGRRLLVEGRAIETLFVDGDLKATTNDGRVAQVAGRWTVASERHGLRVQLQVPSERYVMAVLQAEASADEPMESLKALAVVARSFATQSALNTHGRHADADVCDSTHCQALRFGAVPERVRAAVEAPAGETLWLGLGASARQIAGYFTENCDGMTEDAAALWGGESRPWLRAHPDPYCVRRPALWHAELSLAQIRNALAAEGITVPAVVGGLRVVRNDASGRVVEL